MPQKVFLLSDAHDDLEAMARAADYIQAQGADQVLFLGDFLLRPYAAEDFAELVQTRDAEAFVEKARTHMDGQLHENKAILNGMGVPYKVVPGNYDPLLSEIFADADLHKKTTGIGDAKVAGYGGADSFPQQIQPLVQLGQIAAFDHHELYRFLSQEDPDIVVLHNPPKQLGDTMFNGAHPGTPAATQYILDNKPDLVVAGHIHEAGPLANNPEGTNGLTVYEHETGLRTYVINPGNVGRFEMINFPSMETARTFPYGTFAHVEMEDDGTPTRLVQYALHAPERTIGQVRVLDEFDLTD